MMQNKELDLNKDIMDVIEILTMQCQIEKLKVIIPFLPDFHCHAILTSSDYSATVYQCLSAITIV